MDNRMYTAGQADIHLRLKRGAFEVHGTLQRGEWGVTQDDAGRIYRNTNESALHVDYVPTAYYARNPNLLRTRGSYERLDDEAHSLDTVWPVRPNPGTNRAYQTGIDRAGRLAREVHVRLRSSCVPRRQAAGGSPRQRLRRGARRQPGEPSCARRRRPDARGAQSVRAWRVPGVDRRALPAGVSVRRAGRHSVHRRHVSRDHRTSHLDHGVPARSDPVAQAGPGDGVRPHLSRRARDDAAGYHRRFVERVSGTAGPAVVASERLAARHGAATAGRAPWLAGFRIAGTRANARHSRRGVAREAGGRAHRTGGLACTRCGRSTGSTRSSQRW